MSSVAVDSHEERLRRTRLCLDGLSVGDAYGELFFHQPVNEILPSPPWPYTDDTVMATAIYEQLAEFGEIHPEPLAKRFAQRYLEEPLRGYGRSTISLLKKINNGVNYLQASRAAFNGQGSMGNGSAMRVAPIGAYFADDIEQVMFHARNSASTTHANRDGVDGAVAVAVAVATARTWIYLDTPINGWRAVSHVASTLPSGAIRDELEKASIFDGDVLSAAAHLGNGSKVLCSDTVPFCIWNAFRVTSFEDAMQTTVSVGGDMDTNCAIVGAIVSMAGHKIPKHWLAARESLKMEVSDV